MPEKMSLPKVQHDLCVLIADQAPGMSELLLDYAANDISDVDSQRSLQRRLNELGVKPHLKAQVKHDHAVNLARKAVAQADVLLASSAFICSINKPQDGTAVWLNPLRAISILQHLPKHKLKGELACEICGGSAVETVRSVDLAANIRTGWSGDDFELVNQLMTVLWFNATQPPTPNAVDMKVFKAFLNVIRDAEPKTTAVQLNKILIKHFRGSEGWMFHLETLGFCGVLDVPTQPGNLQQWTDFSDRRKPINVETRTPTCHWRRGMGFNVEVFSRLFPEVPCPKELRANQKA